MHSSVRRAGRHGFTLIEVMVTLVVAATVTLVAHEVFRALIAGQAMVVHGWTAASRQGIARSTLASAMRSAFASQDRPFDGTDTAAVFGTLMQTADGWFQPADVRLRIGPGGLELEGGPPRKVVLDPGAVDLRIDYLVRLGADAPWATAWLSPVSPPAAVRLRVTRRRNADELGIDTLILLVRGAE